MSAGSWHSDRAWAAGGPPGRCTIAQGRRARGGPSPKIHALTDGCGRAVAILLRPANHYANSRRNRLTATVTEAVILFTGGEISTACPRAAALPAPCRHAAPPVAAAPGHAAATTRRCRALLPLAGDARVCCAICRPQRLWPRGVRMRPASAAAIWRGISFGCDERSCIPSRPSAPEARGPAARDLAGTPHSRAAWGFSHATGDNRNRHRLSTDGRRKGSLVNGHLGCS